MTMATPTRSAAEETMLLLEQRLKRLEFYLGNHAPRDGNGVDASGDASVAVRLARVERELGEYCSKNPAATQLLKIRM